MVSSQDLAKNPHADMNLLVGAWQRDISRVFMAPTSPLRRTDGRTHARYLLGMNLDLEQGPPSGDLCVLYKRRRAPETFFGLLRPSHAASRGSQFRFRCRCQ